MVIDRPRHQKRRVAGVGEGAAAAAGPSGRRQAALGGRCGPGPAAASANRRGRGWSSRADGAGTGGRLGAAPGRGLSRGRMSACRAHSTARPLGGRGETAAPALRLAAVAVTGTGHRRAGSGGCRVRGAAGNRWRGTVFTRARGGGRWSRADSQNLNTWRSGFSPGDVEQPGEGITLGSVGEGWTEHWCRRRHRWNGMGASRQQFRLWLQHKGKRRQDGTDHIRQRTSARRPQRRP